MERNKLIFKEDKMDMVAEEFGVTLPADALELQLILRDDGKYALWSKNDRQSKLLASGQEQDGLLEEFKEYADLSTTL